MNFYCEDFIVFCKHELINRSDVTIVQYNGIVSYYISVVYNMLLSVDYQ